MSQKTSHSADASALGFYYQSFFALKTLIALGGDDSAVAIERADDVELQQGGLALLFQLKHSMSATPTAITISSRALWRSLKVWIDVLPKLSLSQTLFHLVTVGPIASTSPLEVLKTASGDRKPLAAAFVAEAERVIAERQVAALAGKALPHADRFEGCAAFLALTATARLNLLRRIRCEPGSLPIDQMEGQIASLLTLIKPGDRAEVAKRLIEWWDRQVVYALCGARLQFITRTEFQEQLTELIADIEQDKLIADFETITQPADYQPDGMLTRQITLVDGQGSDLTKAIREEWRARQQRSKWINDKPGMAVTIDLYDRLLKEHWSDRHSEIAENCVDLAEADKRAKGLALLRWSHNDAPKAVRPIVEGFEASYYVRGSFQVLAIAREVGWHPQYVVHLVEDET
jgi:hypothetical protein